MKNINVKATVKTTIIYLIVLLIYNVLFWVIPFKHDSIFIGAYVLGTVAILAQVAVLFLANSGATSLKKKVYAFPIIRMGIIYLVVQLIISVAFAITTTFVEGIPTWIIYVISAVILGIFTIFTLLTDTARDEIVKIEDEEERNTVQVKTFRINIDRILRRANDAELLKKLNKLSDIARYSDPVSSEELVEIEEEITEKITEIEYALRINNIESAKFLTEQAINLFEDRNDMCKTYKK